MEPGSASASAPAPSASSSSAGSRESVIVVMDADRSRINTDALSWALENVVRPKDTVVVLGVLCEFGKKPSCFPFFGIGGISAIWEKLDFSAPSDMSSKMLEDDIVRKQEEFQSTLQPFYRQCKRNEVKLELKLAAGYSPKTITVEEARNTNTRWIVLESRFKKDRVCIYAHVGCSVAALKGRKLATIIPSLATESDNHKGGSMKSGEFPSVTGPEGLYSTEDISTTEESISCISTPNPHWIPLSRQPSFPRSFTIEEVASITSGFSEESLICERENMKVYQGTLLESPLIVKCYPGDDERFYSELEILVRVRHRKILNLVGYCCTDDSLFILIDHPGYGSLKAHLQCDETAKHLSWKARRKIAIEIGCCLRYMHEECIGGPIVHRFIRSSCIYITPSHSVLLTNFSSAKWLKNDYESSSMENSIRHTDVMEEELKSFDIRAYGLLLVELITGHGSLELNTFSDNYITERVMPLLDDGSLGLIMDLRLTDVCEADEIKYIAAAALLCLKNNLDHHTTMSEVVAALQGVRLSTVRW